jgi:hypothetical protein
MRIFDLLYSGAKLVSQTQSVFVRVEQMEEQPHWLYYQAVFDFCSPSKPLLKLRQVRMEAFLLIVVKICPKSEHALPKDFLDGQELFRVIYLVLVMP